MTGREIPHTRLMPPRKQYRAFSEALMFVRGLGLQSVELWIAYCRGQLPNLVKPADIPPAPHYTYRDCGWQGYGHWLGTDRLAHRQRRRQFWPYAQARRWVCDNLRGEVTNWRAYCVGKRPDLPARPAQIPTNPHRNYAGQGWVSYQDFLGVVTRPAYRSFEEARAFVRSLGLCSRAQWAAYHRGERPDLPPPPHDLPLAPHQVYARQWVSWPDWLGTTPPPFAQLCEHARRLRLRSRGQWEDYVRGARTDLPPPPPNTPLQPHTVYRQTGWIDWWDFLGKPRA